MKIMLKNVRLSFPSLFKTEWYAGADTEKFAATFLIPKSDTKTVATIESACKQALIDKFGEGKIPKGFKMPLADGDEKDYQGYQDHFIIKANNKKRPTLVNRDKTPIVEEDGILYGGCYVNASIDLWVMDNAYGKKVLASLNAIQFVKDGEAFGTKSEGADCFESLDDDDDFLN
jgi:hypothetical protein